LIKATVESALLTDLYELTMLQAYFARQMNGTAVFELFVRKLPENRHFLLAAGLEQAIDYMSNLRFDEVELAWLRACGRFDDAFIESLRDFRFTGEVDAMPEGTVFFANEPILRITAPLREAQFVESRLMNLMHLQTLVASKAARCVLAAPGKRLIDFGLRRAHGAEAGLLSARASYIAGFDGTATTLAAPRFGIPVFGTMAHSFVQAHDSESDAFATYAQVFPNNTTLLIDTYDTDIAAHHVVALAHELEADGNSIAAVRIDSGDLAETAQRVRRTLDEGGCHKIGIVASGNLDEYALRQLVRDNAPIDAFGVGTRMNTSADAPYLDCAYKIEEYAGQPKRKLSPGKETWPGRKQVFRTFDASGVIAVDTLALEGDRFPGEPLLKPVMRAGKLLQPLPSLDEIRAHARQQLASLPASLQSLDATQPFQVIVSASLHELASRVDSQMTSPSCNRNA